MLGKGVDFVDFYFEKILFEFWSLEDSIVKGVSFNVGGGVGVWVLCGEKIGFFYFDLISVIVI